MPSNRISAATRASRGGRPAVLPMLLLAVLLAGLDGCATNPVTGKKEFSLLSEAQEIQLGLDSDPQVRSEMGAYPDQELQRYVDGIGQRLAANSQRPTLPWHFTVVDVPAVNAFALPGGYIYITRGILAYLDNEAELAGVLGHEIGHVTARHAAQQYTRSAGATLGLAGLGILVPATRPFGEAAQTGLGLLFMKYSRDDELQADDLGAKYAAKNGWDPSAVPEFLTTLGRIDQASDRRGIPNWLSTHPQPVDRVQRIRATVADLRVAGADRAINRDGYLRHVDGIIFGDNPREGVVRGADFLHPDLRFALRFPSGWEINNGKTQVVAKSPGAELYMLLQIVQKPSGSALSQVAQDSMQRAGFQRLDGGSARINGLDAYVGTYQGNLEGLGQSELRAAHIAHEGQVYLLAGLAPTEAFSRVDRQFTESIRSFRPLGRGEADGIRPNRVDLYVATAGDTWQSIAERAGRGIVSPATLAIMNNHDIADQPRPGERLKIVVAG
jgi:predicted Zn-dependent protease